MASFNPFLVDEIVTQTDASESYFGLIADSDSYKTELHGFEITMSGKLVLPEFRLPPEPEVMRAATC